VEKIEDTHIKTLLGGRGLAAKYYYDEIPPDVEPVAAYDPRGLHGNGLTYGTSNRGACHNVGGWTIRAELQSGQYDRYALKGKGRRVKNIQDNRAYVDSLGVCTVARGSLGFSDKPQGEVMKAATGYDFAPELMNIGARVYTLERLILNREGIDRDDDQLPERITDEAIPNGPTEDRILTREMYATMFDEYYQVRGWSDSGVVREDTVEQLGLTGLV
jgi:aldehyde:ferredoxin oxidoreductase